MIETLLVLPSDACSSFSIVPSDFKALIWLVSDAQIGSGFAAACGAIDEVERSKPEFAHPPTRAAATTAKLALPREPNVMAHPHELHARNSTRTNIVLSGLESGGASGGSPVIPGG